MKMLPAAALLLATVACAPVPDEEGQPAPAGSRGLCAEAGAQFALGQPYSDALAERARVAAGAATVRRLEPGQVITMEFNGTRLNLETDAAARVIKVRCG